MVATFDPDEALDVSEEAVLALFGRDRTAVLRMSGLPMQKDSEKEWKMRRSQAATLEAQGRTVPSGFLAAMWFFSFQFNRNLLLTASPLKVHDVEQWAWMFARWAIAEASDMSKDSEFLQVVSKADSLSAQIQDFLRGMGSARWVAGVVERGVAEQRLRDLHSQMRTLGRVHAHDNSTLEAFIDSLWKQLLTQSAMFVSLQAREAYCARAFLCMATSFICGLRAGTAEFQSAGRSPGRVPRRCPGNRWRGCGIGAHSRVRYPAGLCAVVRAGRDDSSGPGGECVVLDCSAAGYARLFPPSS